METFGVPLAELDADSKIAFLILPTNQALLDSLCADARDDLAVSSSSLLRGLAAPFRFALLEQRKLRQKALRKHPDAMRMLFTPLGQEQMTHATLARYKAERIGRQAGSVVDLCCGLGGDSLFLPSALKVVGVDRSLGALRAYQHNVARLSGPQKTIYTVLADVSDCPVNADAAIIDPSRRVAGKSDRWQDQDMSPGWDVLEKLIGRYQNMAIKLGPGIQLPEFLEENECEYLGLNDECLEVTVWTGSLGRKGLVKATETPEGVGIEAMRSDLADSFSRVEEPGEFLYEPVKSVVRAHLFGVLAERLGLWQLDGRIAYLSGNRVLANPLLKGYRLLKTLPYDLKALREFLRREEVGRLEIKKRGLHLIPEEFRAGLKLAGPNSGTLIFTRVLEKKTVFWAKALGDSEARGLPD